MRGVLTGTPSHAEALVEWTTWQAATTTPRRHPWRRPRGDPGVPEHATGQDQPRAGRAAHLRRRPPAGLGPAPRGGRPPGRHLQRVLHPARARQRHRRLRQRHRRHRPRPAARRGRADPSARPAPHRRHDPPAAPPAGPTARPAHRAARPGLDGRHARRSCSTDAWTSWPPTSSGSRCSRRSTPTRSGRPTTPGSSSWIRTPPSSSVTGTRSPTTPSPCCAPRPAATPTTGGLSDLIGELSTRSEEFRVRWAAHHVRIHTTGVKRFHHPVVGDLELAVRVLPAGRRSQPEPPHLHRRARVALPGRPAPAGQLGRDHRRHRAGLRRPTTPQQAESVETPD